MLFGDDQRDMRGGIKGVRSGGECMGFLDVDFGKHLISLDIYHQVQLAT